MVLDDRQLRMRELADMVGISKSVVHRLLTENLDLRNLCTRCVPRLLTKEQNSVMGMFHSNKADFSGRSITTDEKSDYKFTPKTKKQ